MEINHFIGEGVQYNTDRCDVVVNRIFNDHEVVCGSLNLIQIDDEGLLEINRTHLNHDYYTDIITFRTDDGSSIESGELYMSYDRASENSPNNVEKEILRLIFHGCLHLCGWDDGTDEEKRKMREQEDKYLLFHVEQ